MLKKTNQLTLMAQPCLLLVATDTRSRYNVWPQVPPVFSTMATVASQPPNTISLLLSINICSVSLSAQYYCLLSFYVCSVSLSSESHRLLNVTVCSVSLCPNSNCLLSHNVCSVSLSVHSHFLPSHTVCSVCSLIAQIHCLLSHTVC